MAIPAVSKRRVISIPYPSYTVSVGVPTFLVRGDVYFWGSMMAACLIASLPIAIIYNFFVDQFVAGRADGPIQAVV